MQLNAQQRSLVERTINAIETGKADGDYGAIVIFNDGPHDIRQITYGRAQTTEYGNLRELVRMYVDANGRFSAELAGYAERVGSVALTDDATFRKLLRDAGRQDPVMRGIQDAFFEKRYFKPAMAWADAQGFALPLSALVIYDSFIHSGSILWLLRQRFDENPPSLGGDERRWISEYVRVRHAWLGSHHRPIVRRTVYRTDAWRRQIDTGNWDLSRLPLRVNGIDVRPA